VTGKGSGHSICNGRALDEIRCDCKQKYETHQIRPDNHNTHHFQSLWRKTHQDRQNNVASSFVTLKLRRQLLSAADAGNFGEVQKENRVPSVGWSEHTKQSSLKVTSKCRPGSPPSCCMWEMMCTLGCMTEMEQVFESLSSQYLSRIAEERKKADELQLTAINNTLREWMGKIQSNGTGDQLNESNIQITEHDLLKEALSEAKERQGKIITVDHSFFSDDLQ
jgi:hypothetical protein